MPKKKKEAQESEEEKRLFCTKDHWCNTLNDRLHLEANTRRAGLSVCVTTNMKTREHTVQGVSFHQNAKDNGLLMHWCPWCGADLYKFCGHCDLDVDCYEERGKADGSNTPINN